MQRVSLFRKHRCIWRIFKKLVFLFSLMGSRTFFKKKLISLAFEKTWFVVGRVQLKSSTLSIVDFRNRQSRLEFLPWAPSLRVVFLNFFLLLKSNSLPKSLVLNLRFVTRYNCHNFLVSTFTRGYVDRILCSSSTFSNVKCWLEHR